MRNAARHPVFSRLTRSGICDEQIVNNISTMSAAEISAEWTDARLAQLIAEGKDTISLKINRAVLTSYNPASLDWTLVAGASTKLAAIGDIATRFYAAGGRAVIITYLHGGSTALYSKIIADQSSQLATYIATVGGHLGACYSDPRTIHAWAVEAPATDLGYGVATETTLGNFHLALQTALGVSVWNSRTWLVPRLNWSGTSDLLGMLWGGSAIPKNVIARCAYYGGSTAFVITHARTSTEYAALNAGTVAFDLPFTQANCDAIIAETTARIGSADWGASNTRSRADLATAVGYDEARVNAEFALIASARKHLGIPVLMEEVGHCTLAIDLPGRRRYFTWVKNACRRNKFKFVVFSAGNIAGSYLGFGTAAGVNSYDSAIRAAQADCKQEIGMGRFAPPPEWTPSSLGVKLLAWYDFSQVTGSDGATVSTLSPRAGSITTPLTSSGGSMPTVAATIATMNNVRGIACTATQFMSLSGISQAMPLSILIAMDPTINTTAGGDRYTHFTDAPSGTRFTTGALNTSIGTTKNYFLVQSGSVWIDYAVTTAASYWNSPQVFTGVWSATAGKTRVNGVDLKTGTHTQATLTSLRVGASSSGADGLNGYVTDVILTTALTTEELNRLEWWLANKVGVTLPSNPYTGGASPRDPGMS